MPPDPATEHGNERRDQVLNLHGATRDLVTTPTAVRAADSCHVEAQNPGHSGRPHVSPRASESAAFMAQLANNTQYIFQAIVSIPRSASKGVQLVIQI
jgi:hypothetical protein